MASDQRPALFGTDGIRGHYQSFPFTDEGLKRLGGALAEVLPGARVLAGMDTRFSGPAILAALVEGMAGRCHVASAGVVPTPGLSYLVRMVGHDYGLMITASHNPAEDNGIKLFNDQGEKIPDEIEASISRRFWELERADPADLAETGPGRMVLSTDPAAYLDFLSKEASVIDLKGERIVIDCAHGAMSGVAPDVFRQTGARILTMGDRPDGQNINLGCGSQHPEALMAKVREEQAAWGVAFDGDGDRVLLVDGRRETTLDGDDLLYLLARHRLSRTKAFNRVVVGTVMSNLGLEKALQSIGVELVRAQVGDRHVYQEMKRLDAELGGEPSGHIIVRSLQRSGDGLLSALQFFRALSELGLTGGDLSRQMTRFPQGLRSLKISHKPDLRRWDDLLALEREFDRQTGGGKARLLIRYSGTENKIRLMVEADDERVVDTWLERLTQFIKNTIGEKT